MDEAASGCWSRLVELVFGRCCCRRPAGAAVGVAAAPAPCAVNSAKRTRAPDAWFLRWDFLQTSTSTTDRYRY